MDFAYPQNLRFECNKCGICCGDTEEKTRRIIMLESEVQEIQEKTGLKSEEFCFEIQNTEPYRFEMKKAEDGKCLFLKPEGCRIYDVRPLICRFYPFELKFDDALQKYVFTVTLECPTINQGKLWTKTDFKRLFWLAQNKLM